MTSERGDLSFGTNAFLTGLAALIGLPVLGIVRGDWRLVGGGVVVGAILLSIGYAMLRAEDPPDPPSS